MQSVGARWRRALHAASCLASGLAQPADAMEHLASVNSRDLNRALHGPPCACAGPGRVFGGPHGAGARRAPLSARHAATDGQRSGNPANGKPHHSDLATWVGLRWGTETVRSRGRGGAASAGQWRPAPQHMRDGARRMCAGKWGDRGRKGGEPRHVGQHKHLLLRCDSFCVAGAFPLCAARSTQPGGSGTAAWPTGLPTGVGRQVTHLRCSGKGEMRTASDV